MPHKILATDEQIAAVLQTLGLPVSYGEPSPDELNDYNFIYYRPGTLTKSGISTFAQTVYVYLVSKLSNLEMEMSIIDLMESIKMRPRGEAQYDRVRIAETDDWINVVAFQFTRAIKREACSG